MSHHILIHNEILYLYIKMAFYLNVIGCQSTAGLIHARWLVNKNIKIINFSTLYKGILVIIGFFILSLPEILSTSHYQNITYSLIGCSIGYCWMSYEKNLIRYYARSYLLKNKKIFIKNDLGGLISNAIIEPLNLGLSSNKNKRWESGIRKGSNNMSMSYETYQFNLISLIFTAIFEELLFRGFLLSCCFELNTSLFKFLAIIFITVSFSFSHYNFGGLQVILKILFSLCMLTCVLASHSLLPAIFAHTTFNILAWQYLKNTTLVNTKHTTEQIAVLG